MDAAAQARALDGILAIAGARRSVLEIHDPMRLFTAVRTSAQMTEHAASASSDAARAIDLLADTGLLTPDAAARLAKSGVETLGHPRPDQLRYAASEVTAVANDVLLTKLPANDELLRAVDDRFAELVSPGRVLSRAEQDELALLAMQAGTVKRHGLVPGLAREVAEHGRAEHVLRNSAPGVVERLQAVWHTQLHATPDEITAEALRTLREEGVTPANARRLQTLLLDLGVAKERHLATVIPMVGRAEDILERVATWGAVEPKEELGRWSLERIWRRQLDQGVTSSEQLAAEVRAALDVPVTGPEQSRELLHLLSDMGGIRSNGITLERDGGPLIKALMAHVVDGDAAGAEFARWRMLVRADESHARRIADEAVAAMRAPGAEEAFAVRLVRAEPQLRAWVTDADRLGLLGSVPPASFGDVAPWLDEVDAAVAARPDIPDALRADIDRLRGRIRSYLDGAPPEDKLVGYGHHPDYAEVGRLGEQLRLADALMARPAPSPTSTVADELLAW